jgi:iron(III) transport system ATP-binding protein
MTAPKLLEVQALEKRYRSDSNEGIQQVSFKLGAGKTCAIVGESGSGKSTLLRLIAGMEWPDAGAVLMLGESVHPQERLVPGIPGVAFVAQDYPLPRFQSVEACLRKALQYVQIETASVLLEQVLEVVCLSEFRTRAIEQLSGGQKQRVALALALASEDQVLVLDEPFSGLDYTLRAKIRKAFLDQVKMRGKALVFATHEVSEALAFADQMLVLKQGEVIGQGTPKSLARNPKTLYTASLFFEINTLNHAEALSISDGNLRLSSSEAVFALSVWDISLRTSPAKGYRKVALRRSFFHGDHSTLEIEWESGLVTQVKTRVNQWPSQQPIFAAIAKGSLKSVKREAQW